MDLRNLIFSENKLRHGESHGLLKNVNKGKNKYKSNFVNAEFLGPGSHTN
jgi:hypothetical protein